MILPLRKKSLNNIFRNETFFNRQRASQLYWNGKENKNIVFFVCLIVCLLLLLRKKECAKRTITNVLLCMHKKIKTKHYI